MQPRGASRYPASGHDDRLRMKHKDKHRRPQRSPARRPARRSETAAPPRPAGPARGFAPGKAERSSEDGKDAGSGDLPFDARFFRTQFPHLLPKNRRKQRGSHASYVVNVVLGDGSNALDISHVEELGDDWALFAVFDTVGFTQHDAATRFVFVPYSSIARVEVNCAEERFRAIGFHGPKRRPGRKRRNGT
jgi:hypothetical protein